MKQHKIKYFTAYLNHFNNYVKKKMISITDISISSISTLKLSLNRYMGIYGKPVYVLGGRTKQQWNDVYNYSTYCMYYIRIKVDFK